MSLQALKRKLDRALLAHLVEHCDELRSELDACQSERDELRRRLAYAEDCADMWRDDALQAIRDAGAAPSLTLSGRIVPRGNPAKHTASRNLQHP